MKRLGAFKTVVDFSHNEKGENPRCWARPSHFVVSLALSLSGSIPPATSSAHRRPRIRKRTQTNAAPIARERK